MQSENSTPETQDENTYTPKFLKTPIRPEAQRLLELLKLLNKEKDPLMREQIKAEIQSLGIGMPR